MCTYLHLFQSNSDFENVYYGINYNEPWVSLVDDESQLVKYNKKVNNNGHEYVDLGLPSGLLWATCNVGASVPEDFGDYFAWGEVEPKSSYTKNNNKWFDDTTSSITKYNSFDNFTKLEESDDAAHVVMGGGWKTPTQEQAMELINNTTSALTEINGVSGYLLTSIVNPNKQIFFPNAGWYRNTTLENSNLSDTWLSDINRSGTYFVSTKYLRFCSSYANVLISSRINSSGRPDAFFGSDGHPVRGVIQWE